MSLKINNIKGKIFTILYMTTAILFLSLSFSEMNEIQAEKIETSPTPVQDAKTMEVILQRHYLDGEMSEEVIVETIWSMEDFWSFYNGWQLVDQNDAQIVFKKELNDISPLLKMNGYFGLAEDGTLNIYFGKPDDNEVIQSFFQVNTSRLKSHLHENLKEGIPISSKDNYLEVLKMCEEYAINEL